MAHAGSAPLAVARAGGIDLLNSDDGTAQGCLPPAGEDDRLQAGISLLKSDKER